MPSAFPRARLLSLRRCGAADKLGLIRPIVEQPEYNIVSRQRVEHECVAGGGGEGGGGLDAPAVVWRRSGDPRVPALTTRRLTRPSLLVRRYAPLYRDNGLGLTTWSPLASGVLTGKYSGKKVPEGSRFTISQVRARGGHE